MTKFSQRLLINGQNKQLAVEVERCDDAQNKQLAICDDLINGQNKQLAVRRQVMFCFIFSLVSQVHGE